MSSQQFSGVATAAGGILLIIVNAVFTPMLDLEVAFTEMMASNAYVWRLSLAAVAVFLLMAGAPGLHAHQAARSGLFGKVAFGLTFLGCALLFAHEWAQVFYVHSLAVGAPDALQAIEDAEGMNLYDAEAIIALLTFTFGWIAFAASMIRTGVFTRWGPILIILGFFATPLLTAMTSVKLGGALGNAVLGSGFILLGWQTSKNQVGADTRGRRR
ncbi:MAG: hypothetical protein KJO09_00125 [Gammaproteobacteria bacterium]|nr:hypothetical protein [Gammaproteobacteria bacterium]